MRIVFLILAGVGAAGAWPTIQVGADDSVIVYVCDDARVPSPVMFFAQQLTVKMFAEIGVSVKWRNRRPRSEEVEREHAIVVRMLTDSAQTRGGAALAQAYPFEGSTILVYYQRIEDKSAPTLRALLLAHVLAHEITHNLQRLDHHSETGIMKANWVLEDYARMRRKPLAFTPLDVQLIYLGMASRARANVGAVTLLPPSRPPVH
jgi:hypothetical protein